MYIVHHYTVKLSCFLLLNSKRGQQRCWKIRIYFLIYLTTLLNSGFSITVQYTYVFDILISLQEVWHQNIWERILSLLYNNWSYKKNYLFINLCYKILQRINLCKLLLSKKIKLIPWSNSLLQIFCAGNI